MRMRARGLRGHERSEHQALSPYHFNGRGMMPRTRRGAVACWRALRVAAAPLQATRLALIRQVHMFSTVAAGDVPVPGDQQAAKLVVIYDSPTPAIVRVGSALLSLKAFVALGGAALFGWREVQGTAAAVASKSSDGSLDWFGLWSGTLSVPLPVTSCCERRVFGATLLLLADLSG